MNLKKAIIALIISQMLSIIGFAQRINCEEIEDNSATLTNTGSAKNLGIFEPFAQDLKNQITANWDPPKLKKNRNTRLLFTINKKGEVTKIQTIKPSGNKKYDKAALKALKNSSPFGNLPEEYSYDSIDIMFDFHYNVMNKKS